MFGAVALISGIPFTGRIPMCCFSPNHYSRVIHEYLPVQAKLIMEVARYKCSWAMVVYAEYTHPSGMAAFDKEDWEGLWQGGSDKRGIDVVIRYI